MPDHQIPFYHLYGESFIRHDPGFVHLEDIASRSQGLGWEISPHRHNQLAQIICVFDNHWGIELDEQKLSLSGNWAVVIPPGVVHGFHFSPGTRGYVLSINTEVLCGYGPEDTETQLSGLVWQPQTTEFRNMAQAERFHTLLSLLDEELEVNDANHAFAVTRLLQLIFVTLARQQKWHAVNSGNTSRETRTLMGFRELIDVHYQEHLSVGQYAQKLHVSVATLNRICQHLLKDSPKSIVHQKLIGEAKRLLIYTRQSIEEISQALGFRDTAYFCRFFKQLTGTTAGAFRRDSTIT